MKSRSCRRYRTLVNTCANCAGSFHPYLGRKDQKFCCQACDKAFKAIELVSKHCPQCDLDFQVPKSIAERFNVCSRACRVALTKYVDCERCGKRFRAEKRLNRHFCSEECRRPPVSLRCDTCQLSFRVSPAFGTRRYCSFACYRKSTAETSIERKMREALEEAGILFNQEEPAGRYSIDFNPIGTKLAIEVDGVYWHDADKDGRRDAWLAKYGWETVRFGELEINATHDLPALVWRRLVQRDIH